MEYRRARFEVLEPRYALSVSIAPIDPVTLLAGAPLNVAVNATDPSHQVLYYKVLSSNPSVVPTLLDPISNRSLKISVSYAGDPNTAADDFSGDMTFQLFEQWSPKTTARFIELAERGGEDNTPFYDGLTFHRVIDGFMVQGGDPEGDGTGGSGTTFDDEFYAELQFTSSGILAMANSFQGTSGSDTNDSQFFITDAPTRWLDFKHTIFGFLTKGRDILQKISAVKTDANDDPPPAKPTYKPKYTVRIDSVGVTVDTEDRVLHLAAAAGTTGSATITVQAIDLDGEGHEQVLASQTVDVTVQADTNNDRPYLNPEHAVTTTGGTPLDAITMVAGTSAAFKVSGIDVEGDTIYYGGTRDPSATDITLNVDWNTGSGLITPGSGAVGVRAVAVGVTSNQTDQSTGSITWDTQLVPVYIRPAAPSVSLAADSDTGLANNDGITNLNNTAGKTLKFTVTGTVSGAVVEVLADGVVIGSTTASGTTTTVQSAGTYTLSNMPHSITARQTLHNQAVDVGNYHDTVELVSDESTAANIVVDTAAPQITSTPVTSAVEGQAYSYPVTTSETGSRQFTMVTAPIEMTVNSTTGVISWTPGEVGGSTNPVTVRLTDAAGNVTDQSFSVHVTPVNAAPTATEQRVRVLSNGSLAITLAGDDGDPDAVQTLTYTIAAGPSHGKTSGFNASAGTLTYTPNANYYGPDSFTFTVTDDAAAGDVAGLTSAPATVSVVVTVQNIAPVADAQAVETEEDTPTSILLTGDDGNTQIDQELTYQIVRQPAHGTLTDFDPTTGEVTYTPAANYNGPDSFTFTVTDDDTAEPPNMVSAPATVSISVAPVNDDPTAISTSVTATKNTPRVITLTGNDGDPEVVQTLTFEIIEDPNHGTLSNFDPATGRVTYTPDPNYSGPDSFTFTVTDDDKAGEPAELSSDLGTISIQVNAVNTPPTATPQNVTTDEDVPLSVTLSGDDGDPGIDQTLRYAIVSGPSHGTLSGFDPATGTVTYTPGPDYSGSDSFTFTVTDDDKAGPPVNLTSSPAQVSISISPVDDAPRFSSTSDKFAFQSQTFEFAVRAYDVDVPADTIRYSLEPGSPEGMSIDAATGKITWEVPRAFPRGTTTVTIRATEFNGEGTAGLSSTQSVNVFVEDLGVLAAASLWANPAGGQSGIPQNSILNAPQSFAPATGFALAASQAAALQALLAGREVPNVSDQVNLLNSASLGEHRLGADTGYGGGMVVNPPDADKQDAQDKAGDKNPANPERRDLQSPQKPTPGAGKKDESRPPAGKQGRGSSARSADVALADLADDAYYVASAAGEEAVVAAE